MPTPLPRIVSPTHMGSAQPPAFPTAPATSAKHLQNAQACCQLSYPNMTCNTAGSVNAKAV